MVAEWLKNTSSNTNMSSNWGRPPSVNSLSFFHLNTTLTLAAGQWRWTTSITLPHIWTRFYQWITSLAAELGEASRNDLLFGVVEKQVQVVAMETILRVDVIKRGSEPWLCVGAWGREKGGKKRKKKLEESRNLYLGNRNPEEKNKYTYMTVI